MLNVKAAAKNMLEELQGRAFGELKTSHEEKILMKRHELENSMYILDLEALFDHLGSPSALGSLGHDTDLCWHLPVSVTVSPTLPRLQAGKGPSCLLPSWQQHPAGVGDQRLWGPGKSLPCP